MTETQLNFKSYFLQFVLCQYVKDLVDFKSEGRFRNRTGITTVSPIIYIIKQFRVQEA